MCTRLNRLGEAVLTSTHYLCFEQTYENYQNFSSESFHFLVVKFSIYLNMRVFVMPKLSPFAFWRLINPQWLELPMSRTNFHGPKDVRAIEVGL